MQTMPSGEAGDGHGDRRDVLVCKGYLWECDGAPPDIVASGTWEVRVALLRAEGLSADCYATDGERMDLRLARSGENDFDGTWQWKATSGPGNAVLRALGDRVFGSGTWYDGSRGVDGRWLFELEVVERRPDTRE